jgi:hypothetical protein
MQLQLRILETNLASVRTAEEDQKNKNVSRWPVAGLSGRMLLSSQQSGKWKMEIL